MKKKLILLFLVLLSFQFNTLAQPISQGSVHIENNTDCDLYYNLHAACPACVDYSSRTALFIAAHTFRNITYSSYPWIPSAPPCTNWSWSYVEVYIACSGPTTYQIYAGSALPSPPFFGCPIPTPSSVTTSDCPCGLHYQVSFVLDPFGNVIIQINP